MPGSPPKRVSEPGTIPPPKTLLSSLFFVSNRASECAEISEIRCGFAMRFEGLSCVLQTGFSAF